MCDRKEHLTFVVYRCSLHSSSPIEYRFFYWRLCTFIFVWSPSLFVFYPSNVENSTSVYFFFFNSDRFSVRNEKQFTSGEDRFLCSSVCYKSTYHRADSLSSYPTSDAQYRERINIELKDVEGMSEQFIIDVKLSQGPVRCCQHIFAWLSLLVLPVSVMNESFIIRTKSEVSSKFNARLNNCPVTLGLMHVAMTNHERDISISVPPSSISPSFRSSSDSSCWNCWSN